MNLKYIPLFAGLLIASANFSRGQTAPTITALNPATVISGGPGFTLTLTGANFTPTTVGQVNGASAPSTYLGATQLQMSITAAQIANPGGLVITVQSNNPATGGVLTSNPLRLVVTAAGAAPAPILTSATPNLASTGTRSLRLTLRGTNFRPGAMVIISPPLAAVQLSTGKTSATDAILQNVTLLGPTFIVADVTVGDQAAPGLRAIDVLNADGTSTATTPAGAPGTSQPLRLISGTALGAPLSVTTIAMLSPRSGSVLTQGARAMGEARLAASGSGTVQGAWFWDGRIVEQFAVTVAGGTSVPVRMRQPFPTEQLGPHTVELRILEPNQLASRPLRVVVNPGGFSVERLLAPDDGALVSATAPPQLAWAPVPGISRYEVGFSTGPYASLITTWHKVQDNHWDVPADVWKGLPAGEIYWTERAVEMTGETRDPLPFRRIWRVAGETLRPVRDQFTLTPQGSPLLEWNGLEGAHLYRITIFADVEGMQVVRRYLSGKPRVDLRALKGKLDPAHRYYWIVELLDDDGNTLMTGPRNTLDFPQKQSVVTLPQRPRVLFAAFPRPRVHAQEQQAVTATQDVKTIASHSPSDNATVENPKTPVQINFFSAPNVFDLALLVDGTDVTSLADVADTKVAYTPPVALAAGEHQVKVTLGDAASSWKFTVKPISAAEAAKRAAAAERRANRALQTETQIAVNTQWASGSDPDVNMTSIAEQFNLQQGIKKLQLNGSGLLDSTLGPVLQRTSRGDFSSFIVKAEAAHGAWGLNLSFGAVAPSFYQNAQLITTAAPRQGIEADVRTPAGGFGFFANTNDVGLGSGFGYDYHQQILGAGWDAPLPKKHVEFRAMWLGARDHQAASLEQTDIFNQESSYTDAVAMPSKGDLYGGLLQVHLPKNWLWASEYSWGYNDATTTTGAIHDSGRAAMTSVAGVVGPLSISTAYLNVSPHFGSPTNPNLSLGSTSDRRGPTGSFAVTTHAGTFTVNDSFQQSNVRDKNVPEQEMNSFAATWSKIFGKGTSLSVSGHHMLTFTGYVPPAVQAMSSDEQTALEADQRDSGADISVSRQVGKTATISLSGDRDWFHNNVIQGSNSISTSATGGVNWIPRPVMQFNGNISLSWLAGNGSTTGTTRNFSGYLQPSFRWQRTGIQVLPIASLNQSQTMLADRTLTDSILAQQYGGRAAWTMPHRLHFAVLTFNGEYDDTKDPVGAYRQQGTTLYMLATFSWDAKRPKRE